jgi:phage shock protein A
MTEYAIVQLRELAKKMIYLEHAARQALERGDAAAARQLWFERVQITSLRSAKLREYWNAETPSVD